MAPSPQPEEAHVETVDSPAAPSAPGGAPDARPDELQVELQFEVQVDADPIEQRQTPEAPEPLEQTEPDPQQAFSREQEGLPASAKVGSANQSSCLG